MQDHTIRITSEPDAATIDFAPTFNVAVPFIDRHLVEGRGAKVAIRETPGREVTYSELAERVDRCGNALLGLGLGRGERVLMMVKDCAEFYFLFWGAIKAGIVPVPPSSPPRSSQRSRPRRTSRRTYCAPRATARPWSA
jgi:acyl-coenzyme A synthetase/AMP-(fatty) acid ligase